MWLIISNRVGGAGAGLCDSALRRNVKGTLRNIVQLTATFGTVD